MAKVTGEATGPPSEKRPLLLEALQAAFDNAPPPGSGTDIQHFRLESVDFEHGGFVGHTVTRVTLEVEDGPLSRDPYRT